MTDSTIGLVDPFSMAVQALLVVGPFEPGLVDIRTGGLDIMTGLTRGMLLSFRRVMMARDTPFRHVRHPGVASVVKWHRQVGFFQFIKDNHVRASVQLGLTATIPKLVARADVDQAPLLCGGLVTIVAATAAGTTQAFGGNGGYLRPDDCGTGLARFFGHG